MATGFDINQLTEADRGRYNRAQALSTDYDNWSLIGYIEDECEDAGLKRWMHSLVSELYHKAEWFAGML